MPVDYDASAQFITKDIGRDVTKGEVVFKAIADHALKHNDDGEVIGRELCLTYASADVTLTEGDEVTYAGKPYEVNDVMADDYGFGYCKLSEEANG